MCVATSVIAAVIAGIDESLHTTYLPDGSTVSTVGWTTFRAGVALVVVPCSAAMWATLRLAHPRDYLIVAAICGAVPVLSVEFVGAIFKPIGLPWFAAWLWVHILSTVALAGLSTGVAASFRGLLWMLRARVDVQPKTHCAHCSYDLSGLAAESPCPECRSLA